MENQPKKKFLEGDFHNGDFSIYNLNMELEEQIRERLERQLWLLQHDRRCSMVEWSLVRPAMEQHLIFPFVSLITQLIEERESVIRKLQAKLNRSTFVNDPARDKEILGLHRQGLSNSEIGRTVGMTRQGVGKALKRLNGNSVYMGEQDG